MRVIEPYVEFAADIECDIAKIAVGSADRARTASAKKNARKTPQMRSRTAGENTHHNKQHPPHQQPPQASTPQHPRGRRRGPESSMRSPRAVKTAPDSRRTKSPAENQSQSILQSQSHLSEDDGSELSVRESLQSLKHGGYKPPDTAPATIYDSMVVPKSSFAKAVDSIAAMKLHDYALKRKERMKNRFRLWDEIKGTTRELEISGAEVAFMEFQEIIAAWKIKYYVTKSRDLTRFQVVEGEKKALIRQCKNLKKKNTQLQSSIDDHLALNLAEEASRLQIEKARLEECLEGSRRSEAGLLEEIGEHKQQYSQLEGVLEDKRKEFEAEVAVSARQVEDARADTAFVREDLEVSRRTAQEYLRSVMQLEVTLQERIDEITGLRDGDLQESRQKSIKIEAMERELEQLQNNARGDAEQIQALELSTEQLQRDVAEVKRLLKETEENKAAVEAKRQDLQTKTEEQQVKITSLEKLVTEVTFQKEQFARQLADKGVVAGNYLVETVQLKEVIAEKESELEEHKFALQQMEEYTKYAQDVNEIANAERETALMAGEDLLVQLGSGKDSLQQNEGYCRMLEAQLLNVRRKEHYSKQGDNTQARKGDDLDGQTSTSVLKDKMDFTADEEADYSHPLEGRLVSLLGVLENKLGQLDSEQLAEGGKEKGSRRKSIKKVEKITDSAKKEVKEGDTGEEDKDNDAKDKDKADDDNDDDDNDAVGETKSSDGKSSDEKESKSETDGGSKDAPPEEDEEVDWEEVCLVLEEQLATEKTKLEGLKEQLAAARENIQRMQKEKERLKVDIKKWQKNEQKRTGKMPTAKGNSVDSRKLFTRSDEVEMEMQKFLEDAQSIATTALNCKMECDRIQDELYEADAEAYEVRLAAQQEAEAEHRQLVKDTVEEERARQDPAPPKPRRNENRATISMLNQGHFATNLSQRKDDDLDVLREEDEEDEEDSGGSRPKAAPRNFDGEGDGSNLEPRKEGGVESMSFHDKPGLHEKSAENSMLAYSMESLDSGQLLQLDQDYMEQVGKQSLDAEGAEQLFRLIHTKLNHHRSILQELEEEKNVSRQQIEKWTLYFLRDQGRVPGLSDSKYGANNLVFHNFNAVEGDIYSHHQTIQNIFSDFDAKRDGILNLNDQNLTEQLMQVEEHFDDPIFSLQENEEYEDSFKLHFASVEAALLSGQVDDEAVQDEEYLPNNTLVFDEIEDAGKLDILANLTADIKSFQDDVAELHISLQDSRETAERLHDSLKFQKSKIRQWHERFEGKFGRAPTEEDKEKEASHLYLKAHEVHSELEAEMEKMRVFALIATAKNTEADRLKVLKRKFARQAPPDYLPSEDSSVASSFVQQRSISRAQAASADLREHSRNSYESKAPTIKSNAGEADFREMRERLEAEIVKMSDELDMLKNFIRAADTDIDNFRNKKTRLKSEAKKWEQGYLQQHGRKPSVEERKLQAEHLYEDYAKLQEGLSQVLESRERALKMVTKIQQNCDRKRRKLAKVVEKEEQKFPRA